MIKELSESWAAVQSQACGCPGDGQSAGRIILRDSEHPSVATIFRKWMKS